MSYVVGLTGGIGSGKSTIADYFAELGVPIIDADLVARQIVEKGSPLLSKIEAHFGQGILTEYGELDRSKLREIIFHQPHEKTWLNNLLHPEIRMEMTKQLDTVQFPYVLWVVPLLIENHLTELCDRILVVDVMPEIQLERVIKRDKAQYDTVKNIMKAQVDRATRLSYANDVIENNQELSESQPYLKQQVEELHNMYLILANEKEKQC